MMRRLLRTHVVFERTARRFIFTAGVVLLVACTVLVAMALPTFGTASAVGLVVALAATWAVLGVQFPRMMIRDRAARA